MPEYSPSHIASVLNSETHLVLNDNIRFFLTDSRRVIHAAQSLFFAIKGKNHDGHLYIDELYKAGVRNFVVEHIPDQTLETVANFYIVNNSINALQQLAAYHRDCFNYPVIGITGSNGKTIVKEWIYQVLSGKYNIVRNPRSYNSQTGVPLSVWNMENDNNLGIFEAGISLPGEMEKLENVIKPTIGIFTNIGDAHQENFNSISEKVKEKIKLFKHSKILIFCLDHEEIRNTVNEEIDKNNTQLFTWSLKNKASLFIKNITIQKTSSQITGVFENKETTITIPFTDKGSVENAIHVWSLLLYMKIDETEIKELFSALSPVAMRLEQKSGINNCTIINDSYNSDMNSIMIALDYLNQQYQHKKKTVIISDIIQSSSNQKLLYSEVADILRTKKIDRIIGIGPVISQYKSLFGVNAEFYEYTEEFLESFDPESYKDESILLKGARAFKFEKIEQLFEQKVHCTVLQINLDAVVHNLNYFRSLLKPETRIMAMVKAISYGSGTFEIAHLLKFHHIDYLGVAYIDEGIQLRKAGVSTPIMVMNPEVQYLDQLIEYGLEPEIYSHDILKNFKKVLAEKGEKNHPCHIKFDSGMHRLGFMPDDISFLISELSKDDAINVKSIFSHLAASDDTAFDQKTRHQIGVFENFSDQLIKTINYPVIRHILNSSGIVRFPEAQFDMVRLGIGLYGFAGSSENKLRNVFTLKTVVSQVKMARKGETVGYNPKNILEKDTRIGIIAIGYADGYNRKLGNGIGKVMINKKLVPIIGNICMDMCMVDLSGIENVMEGDEVIVFGDDYTAQEIAGQLDTIPYEVITNISERINRVYYKE